MEFQLNFRSGMPIYLQLTEQIRQKLAAGELKIGDQLPTVRQLATELRINFNTVARAYRLLDEAGLISTQRGRGTYIWEQPNAETMSRLRQQGLEGLTRRFLAEASRLAQSPDEVAQVFSMTLQQLRDNGKLPEIESE